MNRFGMIIAKIEAEILNKKIVSNGTRKPTSGHCTGN
ncbi:hypothetical protein EV201_1122 [Ancylomarina subtilis]|uniref:Uncharacterized protein n=1 Tax=Ancylomarina subtilis TaxID=1639035 RepID=A0A4Q7VK35_9BACT|nr:hypothetical protein EV201_1122 [Ancylomarina subtilis]